MPDSTAQRNLRERYHELNNLTKENRDLLSVLEDEGREWTAEEQKTYKARDERIDVLDNQLQRASDQAERETRVESHGAMFAPTGDPEVSTAASEKSREERNAIEARGWDKLLRNASPSTLDAEERAVLQTDDLAGGGYMVAPEQFVSTILKKIEDNVYIRGLSTTETLSNAASMGKPTRETKESDADWTGEVQTIARSEVLVFGKRELMPRLSTKLVRVSRNLVRNSTTPISTFISDEFARLFGETEENAFLTGSGSGRPLGVFTASAQGISTARDVSTGNGTTAIGADNLTHTLYSMKEGYQMRSTWIMHRDVVRDVRLLKDGNGQYLWQAGIAADRPNSIIDRPYRMSEFAPNTFTTGLYVAIIGDFSQYWIVTALDMEIQVIDQLYAETSEFGYIGRMEVDGMPIFEEAFARSILA